MKTCNINILNSSEKFTFPITIEERNYGISGVWCFSEYQNDVYLYRDNHPTTIHQINNFRNETLQGEEIPYAKVWEVTIVFPEYRDHVITNYLLDAVIHIGNKNVHIFSETISTHDIVATPKTMIYDGIRYYECVQVSIPSPFDVVYSDEWITFREELCHEMPNTNNAETLLSVELYPLKDDFVYPDYKAGYTNFSLSRTPNDLTNLLEFDGDFNIKNTLYFNPVYEGDFQLYMSETYGLNDIYNNYSVKQELVLKDSDNIYRFFETDISSNTTVLNKAELGMGWGDWKVGMYFVSTINILDENENELMVLYSNELPITLESFAYLISKNEKIELEEVEMNIYNLDVVNKIEKRIVQVTNSVDDKSNIINNVFVLSSKIDDLVIYPKVTQNVLLPLNGYKNKVTLFYLLIEGECFTEIGRNQQGVIFKIDGNLLPNKEVTGVYHILNESKEMVTMGNYTYK